MTLFLLIILVLLIFISAFFSGSETSMMSLNRYRLRHLAKRRFRPAVRAHRLLQRPDRLLGVILIGNTFANILASAIATIIAVRWYGDLGVAIATVLLTLLILIFAEIIPKTVAAIRPEKFAFPAAKPLGILLIGFYPLVILLNIIANNVLKPFGIKIESRKADPLSTEELRSVVQASSEKLAHHHKNMLLGVLDFEAATVEDVMIPRQNIIGINLEDDWSVITEQLQTSAFSRLPVYNGSLDNVVGIFHLKQAVHLFNNPTPDKSFIEAHMVAPYFIPDSTSLRQQLLNFQENNESLGLIVDEYGEILGLASLEDILEEIAGEFSSQEQPTENDATERCPDGSYIVHGHMTIRDLNRDLSMSFPTDGPKTLSGLIMEHLEAIPTIHTGLKIEGHTIEILEVKDNAVTKAKIMASNQASQ